MELPGFELALGDSEQLFSKNVTLITMYKLVGRVSAGRGLSWFYDGLNHTSWCHRNLPTEDWKTRRKVEAYC